MELVGAILEGISADLPFPLMMGPASGIPLDNAGHRIDRLRPSCSG